MQKRITLRVAATLVAVSLLFAYCKKGDAGPEGPAGPSGPQGPKGDTGTANVIYSAWLDAAYTPEKNANGDTIGYFTNITAPKLTSAILNSGEIKAYMNFGTTTNPDVVPLPLADPFYGMYITVDLFVQRIYLYSNFDAGTYTDGGAKRLQYRYILIPGSVQGRMAKIDWNDYNKVKEQLQLPD
jgi:hypothetical protein